MTHEQLQAAQRAALSLGFNITSEVAAAVFQAMTAATPAATWRAEGQPDPHGDRYNCERAKLAMGNLTDDQLANAVFMYGNETPNFADVIAGKAHMPISYLTAAKDRIRWLSRKLEDALTAQQAAAPEGWKLVPAEPTLEMGWAYLQAAEASNPGKDYAFNHPGYRAMLAAAPAAPQQGVAMPGAEGSAAQKSFWAGFEASAMSKSTNIREAWNQYKATDEFARLNPSAQGEPSHG